MIDNGNKTNGIVTEVDLNNNFANFLQAQTCNQTFSTFHILCNSINLQYPPCENEHSLFYPRLKKLLASSWKAVSIWGKLDRRFYGKEYFVNPKLHKMGGTRIGESKKVMIIGAGPCGLRTAIEMACLGTKTVVVEKRDAFSRNNVLHLWPFIIKDLRSLGAKKFYGRFCAGAIDHISIRQLQLILLKISLCLGVEVIVNCSFVGLVEPTVLSNTGETGWTAQVEPCNHPVSKFEFSVIVGADGKRNTLQGFKRKEFRGKIAIGLTANFINRNTTAEAKVEEISGVAYIFNQQFFKDLHEDAGIDLENIVYYKGETHYFVMTAKKHSLVSKGVFKKNYDDIQSLMCHANVDREAMKNYAREAANFSTKRQLPNLDFAINQFAEPDIALFDFTCMYAAENAALFHDVNGSKLISSLVGDSLIEPFWPMGTGCARGFFAAFDLVWMVRRWFLGQQQNNNNSKELTNNALELKVLCEREAIYRLLHQTTPQNTVQNFSDYTIDPNTRYKFINYKLVSKEQVKPLYLGDREFHEIVNMEVEYPPTAFTKPRSLTRKVSFLESDKLLKWCRRITNGYESVHVFNMTSSWKNGFALCAIIHQFRPDLINWDELDPKDSEGTNQLAFDVADEHLGISPVMTGKEMATCSEVDKLIMIDYISQFYEVFKKEKSATLTRQNSSEGHGDEGKQRSPSLLSSTSPVGLLTRLTQHIKRRSVSNKVENQPKKKKYGLFKRKGSQSESLEDVPENENKENKIAEKMTPNIQESNPTVRLRQKTPESGQSGGNQRQSNRISALSNQLMSQFEQNAPDPIHTKNNKPFPVSGGKGGSDKCHFCEKRLYIAERMSAKGLFFHRQCFVCAHCRVTLRLGNYEYCAESGKFFCRAHYFAHSDAFKSPSTQNVVEKSTEEVEVQAEKCHELEDQLSPLKSDVVKLRRPLGSRSYKTPERIELENIRDSMLNHPKELSEEALTQHNLSGLLQNNENGGNDDEAFLSDSSDEDIDWEKILRGVNGGSEQSSDDSGKSDENDDSSQSSSSKDNRNDITTMSWLDDGSYIAHHQTPDKMNQNLFDDHTMTSITDSESEEENSTSSLKRPLSPVKEELDTTSRSEDSLSQVGGKEQVKRGPSLSSSLSSLDDQTHALVELYHKQLSEKSKESADTNIKVPDKIVDVQISHNTGERKDSLSSISTASSDHFPLPDTEPTIQSTPQQSLPDVAINSDKTVQPCDHVLQRRSTPKPVKKPRTIFNILSETPADENSRKDALPVTSSENNVTSSIVEKTDSISASAPIAVEPVATSKTSNAEMTSRMTTVTSREASTDPIVTSRATAMKRAGTLDRVEKYLQSTPVTVNIEQSINESGDVTLLSSGSSDTDDDVLLSSASSSSSSSQINTASLEITELLGDNSNKATLPPSSRILQEPPTEPKKRVLPRQSSVETILIRASYSGKDDTSVWSNLTDDGDDVNTPTNVAEESVISAYRPNRESLENEANAQSLQRKLSYDSLELRMKLRLRARNQWLRQESQESTKTPEEKEPPLDDDKEQEVHAEFVDITLTRATPLTPNAPPFDSDTDQFFTPCMKSPRPRSKPLFSPLDISNSFLDRTDDFASALDTPNINQSALNLPNPPTSVKRALPQLPKIPHLEALSPTQTPTDPPSNKSITNKPPRSKAHNLSEDKLAEIDQDFKEREKRVKQKVEKLKAETLRRNSKSDHNKSSSSLDETSNKLAEQTCSGTSPKPKRKTSFRNKLKKLNRKKKSNDSDDFRIKRALPVPQILKNESSSAVESTPKEEDAKKKKKTRRIRLKPDIRDVTNSGSESAEVKDKRPKSIFGISPRKKEKKTRNKMTVDGATTLERKYPSEKAREEAILRGERFRVLPQVPALTESGERRTKTFSSQEKDRHAELRRKSWSKRRSTLAGLTPAQIDAKINRRVQIAARRQGMMEAQKRLRRAQVIQRQLEEVEVKQKDIGERGVVLEKLIREEKDVSREREWMEMIQEKNALLRYENELMIYQRELQLEDVQSRLQQDLRERIAMADHRKTAEQLAQEKDILQKMLDVVEQRNQLVDLLDEQRKKEKDEVVDTETFMLDHLNTFPNSDNKLSSSSST